GTEDEDGNEETGRDSRSRQAFAGVGGVMAFGASMQETGKTTTQVQMPEWQRHQYEQLNNWGTQLVGPNGQLQSPQGWEGPWSAPMNPYQQQGMGMISGAHAPDFETLKNLSMDNAANRSEE